MDKASLRQYYRSQRKRMSEIDRAHAAEQARQHLISFPPIINMQRVAFYFPLKTEFDVRPLINDMQLAGKAIYLPRCDEDHQTLTFHHYQVGDAMVQNKYHIPEPLLMTESCDVELLDCVMVPCLAADKKGHRLGTGGGYYDRTFAKRMNHHKKPFLIGVTYQSCYVDSLPYDEWDIILDAILTEIDLYQNVRT